MNTALSVGDRVRSTNHGTFDHEIVVVPDGYGACSPKPSYPVEIVAKALYLDAADAEALNGVARFMLHAKKGSEADKAAQRILTMLQRAGMALPDPFTDEVAVSA